MFVDLWSMKETSGLESGFYWLNNPGVEGVFSLKQLANLVNIMICDVRVVRVKVRNYAPARFAQIPQNP